MKLSTDWNSWDCIQEVRNMKNVRFEIGITSNKRLSKDLCHLILLRFEHPDDLNKGMLLDYIQDYREDWEQLKLEGMKNWYDYFKDNLETITDSMKRQVLSFFDEDVRHGNWGTLSQNILVDICKRVLTTEGYHEEHQGETYE